jgi:hypothetical protein
MVAEHVGAAVDEILEPFDALCDWWGSNLENLRSRGQLEEMPKPLYEETIGELEASLYLRDAVRTAVREAMGRMDRVQAVYGAIRRPYDVIEQRRFLPDQVQADILVVGSNGVPLVAELPIRGGVPGEMVFYEAIDHLEDKRRMWHEEEYWPVLEGRPENTVFQIRANPWPSVE